MCGSMYNIIQSSQQMTQECKIFTYKIYQLYIDNFPVCCEFRLMHTHIVELCMHLERVWYQIVDNINGTISTKMHSVALFMIMHVNRHTCAAHRNIRSKFVFTIQLIQN